jgi:hypothetical protein
MKKAKNLIWLTLVVLCLAFVAERANPDDIVNCFIDFTAGYAWTEFKDYSIKLDGLTNGIRPVVNGYTEFGHFYAGGRVEFLSVFYILDEDIDKSIIFDQFIVNIFGLDMEAGFSGFDWMLVYLFSGGTMSSYSLFHPLHKSSGSRENVFGLRIGAGILLRVLRIGEKINIMIGTEFEKGRLFLKDLRYASNHLNFIIRINYSES